MFEKSSFFFLKSIDLKKHFRLFKCAYVRKSQGEILVRYFAVLSERERGEYFMQDVGLFPLSVRFIAILGVKYNRWP